jgi:hypothetical protein
MAESGKRKAEGRKQKAEGRRQKRKQNLGVFILTPDS